MRFGLKPIQLKRPVKFNDKYDIFDNGGCVSTELKKKNHFENKVSSLMWSYARTEITRKNVKGKKMNDYILNFTRHYYSKMFSYMAVF